jgi:hypothetical protein
MMKIIKKNRCIFFGGKGKSIIFAAPNREVLSSSRQMSGEKGSGEMTRQPTVYQVNLSPQK